MNLIIYLIYDFYIHYTVEQLRNVPVQSYQQIEDRMDEGTRNRTVAATQMNATSSRAHTIVGITFTQKSVNEAGQEMAKVAVVNLVDLAGRWVHLISANTFNLNTCLRNKN